MEIQDLFIGPLYALIIIGVAYAFKNKVEKDLQKYFMHGIYLKILGCVFISLVYVYYYGTGDSIYYFRRASFITEIFYSNTSVGLKLLFNNPHIFDYETSSFFEGLRAFDMSSFLVVRFAAFFNLFSFDSFLGVGLIFTALSYIGIWKMYVVFAELFPKYKKELAIGFIYMPSVFFWGSGILKDCLTFGFLGLLIYSSYNIFIKRKKYITSVPILMISFYIIGIVKSYILMALLPALAVWVFLIYRSKIKSAALKGFVTPFLLVVAAIVGFFMLQTLASTFQKFSIDNFQERAEDMQRWHTYRVEVLKGGDGSSYSLGSIDFSTTGILKKVPAAINVTLFRPYFWEARNPLVFLSAIESFVLFYFSILSLFYFLSNIKKGSVFLEKNPSVIFMLIFSLIFAFAVGFTSYNFGALSRYRIPMIPFYFGAVYVMYKSLKKAKE